jgi:hypothetical protein
MSQSTKTSHQFLEVPERRYDATADRLFLVYYALPPGFNANKWGVSPTSIDANIHTAVNKPVVVYRKSPTNPYHTHQAGNFVHPTLEEAQAELGHPPNAEEYFNWQEKFAVGRVRSVDKRDKGYAFTLEITDTDAKQILKESRYQNGIPGWTSPQILSNSGLYPEEERSNLFNHWVISHIALVDVPAYGPEQAGLRGKCLGAEKECLIKTRSASQENLGFCVKQATIDLVESRSSLNETLTTSSHNIMSESPSTNQQQPVSGQTVTFNPQTATTVDTSQQQPQSQQQPPLNKASSESEQQERPRDDNQPEREETEHLSSNEPKTLQEAQAMVRQMSELLRETNKQLKSQGKELEQIRTERKQARLSYIIPRDLFKSDESHAKEVQRTMNENISEQWLIEYWKTKRELAMAQHTSKRMIEEPLVAKSASSVQQNGHDVPDFSSSQNTAQTSNVQKQLELQRRILDGGVI